MNRTTFSRLALAIAFVVSTGAAFAQTQPTTNPLQARRAAPAAQPAPAATAPATTGATTAAPAKTKSAGAQRRTQCSQEYQAAKTANTLNGQKWPQFYSACNKRLKGAA